jgi:hypothetical protein
MDASRKSILTNEPNHFLRLFETGRSIVAIYDPLSLLVVERLPSFGIANSQEQDVAWLKLNVAIGSDLLDGCNGDRMGLEWIILNTFAFGICRRNLWRRA